MPPPGLCIAMLKAAIFFLVVALIAGALGFGGIAAGAAWIAKGAVPSNGCEFIPALRNQSDAHRLAKKDVRKTPP